jgi:hypothetical protein
LPGQARYGLDPAWAPPTLERETEDLKARAEWLTDELDAVKRRLEELEDTE